MGATYANMWLYVQEGVHDQMISQIKDVNLLSNAMGHQWCPAPHQSRRQPIRWSIHPTSWVASASKNSHLSTLNNGEV
ncbi:hypothetical protein TorRG33x02_160010 [Trema orientale]|uniref:Uncharacterized protein n=1 Tax=Trema orientale TaxID=63057 RepID=A0A2P5ERM4_TREOI|nr:hypothetical protein TorRG33x02_160010 [Trema orientale]